MTIKLVSRAGWGARKARSTPEWLASTKGVKVHYTGSPEDVRMLADHGRCDDRVRQIQAGHMDGNRWIDIGYSLLVCPHGYVYVGRGAHRLPAANGPGLNAGHYAVCALVGNAGLVQPTDAMLHGIRDAIEYLRKQGAGSEIRGHRDGYATDCPGGPLYSWVQRGAPRPAAETNQEEEETMKTVVDLGMRRPVTIPTGQRASLPFEIEWKDADKVHTDAAADGSGYPSVFPKGADAPYAVSIEVILDGRPEPGVEVTVASYARDADDFERDIRGKELAVARDVLHSNIRMSDKHKYRADVVNNSGAAVTVREAYMLIAH